jgi:glycosyltransferase involved in cell wall biosynthesis
VHTHSSKTGFLGRIAARLAGVPKIIHTVHGLPFHPFQTRLVRWFYILLELLATCFCDIVVFVNRSEKEWAEKNFFFTKKRFLTIYNVVDVPVLPTEKKHLPQLSDYLVVGSSCRFSPQKNMVQTIQAAIFACQQQPQIAFVFIGEGEHFALCQKMVSAADLCTRILLPGWQSPIEEWLKQFDCYLLYSLWEGLPLSILEAMACGLPVIGSDIKGNNELISPANGILVPPAQVSLLTDVLAGLPAHIADLPAWGKASRQLEETRFNRINMIQQYRELYER